MWVKVRTRGKRSRPRDLRGIKICTTGEGIMNTVKIRDVFRAGLRGRRTTVSKGFFLRSVRFIRDGNSRITVYFIAALGALMLQPSEYYSNVYLEGTSYSCNMRRRYPNHVSC